MTDKEVIKNMLTNLADANGFYFTDNVDKIVNAKSMMNLLLQCPCDSKNSDRFCISPLCREDIKRDGTCHCKCFKKEP